MNSKATSILKKTVKISGVTCIALGGVALIASGAALKALTEGAKYLTKTIRDVIHEEPETVEAEAEAAAQETVAEESVVEEAEIISAEEEEVIAEDLTEQA